MKQFPRRKRFIFIPLIAIAFLFIISGVVMLLWNAILPDVFGFHIITYWQSMGILVLCKLLFGFGFKGGRPGWGRHMYWQKQMGEQIARMTPEERENFKEEFKRRTKEWYSGSGGCRPPFFGGDRFAAGTQQAGDKDQNQQTNQ